MEHLSLFQLNKLIQKTLDGNLDASYWVIAEIGELRVNQNGHCYLELVEKEDNNIIAKSRATIWANNFRNLSLWFEKMTGQSLQQGLKILCNLKVQFHELYGLSYNIKDIDANFTLGERARKRQEVILKLQEDGVFDLNQTIAEPKVIKNIAVISSPSAAGYEDFLNQLESNRYGYRFDVTLFKSVMQGNAAPESIINSLLSIHNSNTEFDVVVLIRGGGSQIDLDCFDDYELAAHCCQFPLPILSGIGHERDESVLDMISFRSLKTPTAVAEWIIDINMDFEIELTQNFEQLSKMVLQNLKLEGQLINQIIAKIKNSGRVVQSNENHRLNSLKSNLKTVLKHQLSTLKSELTLKANIVDHLNPQNILKRGYTMTSKNGKLIGAQELNIGDIIETTTNKMTIRSKIAEINE
ncbi:exodeoxyribonuclease VII large subunit [Fulvivirga lutimaris]|uniref:exodeoxyribonuclease VII large subunit n=1 Tax=Fulvivirga lutimaris TaxID=1819566 RepID=UPI0012BCC85B|nr:exodeoxyribonuclease VII large subunit [Fulvivirga lutimaris]MTI38426.1 exodeoxyribonuclease VII large subunit [Fulvivirga lutimaris]